VVGPAKPNPKPEAGTVGIFNRYINAFATAGDMVFFDRSWYNRRAVVEPGVSAFAPNA